MLAPETEQEYQQKIRELEKEVKKLNLILQKDSKMKYGLRWIDVPEAFETESENKIPILEEAKNKAIKNDDGKPTHILIEGDNYHALKCLNYTHKGKIDVIYIDPPYNTGSDGFTYKDKRFLDKFPDGTTIPKEHPLRHSTWLSFMSKRLELAKNLLSEKGVIFISIDDNEQANLKLLCDEIFGEENFVGNIIVASNSAKNNSKHISVTHEYLLCYAKNITRTLTDWYVKKTNVDDFKNISSRLLHKDLTINEIHSELLALVKYPKYYEFDHYTYTDKRGPFRASDLTAPNSKNYYDVIHPVTNKPCKYGTRGWAYSKKEMQKLIETDYIFWGEDENTMPQLKNYLFENEMSLPRSVTFFDSQSSTKWLKLQKIPFDFPKSTDYIQWIISMFPNKSATVLDFFAGSGTTLHATMKLNAEDGGNRQCILVQQKEKTNICENITYERNRRVMQGYTNAKGEQVAGLGNSLKYYRTAFVGENDAEYATDKDKITLSKKAGCLLSLAENTLEEYISTDRYQIFGDDKNSFTGIYFSANAETISEFTAKLEQLRNLSPLNTVNAYFFSNGDGTEYADEFTDMRSIKIKSIPEPILEVYRRLDT